MYEIIIFMSLMTILSVICVQFLYKFGIPVLLIFLVLGMLAGSDGLLNVSFSDFELMNNLSILALAFIIFNGGFNTEWNKIKPVILPSVLLSSIGTIITAIITSLFGFYILKKSLWEGFLIGSVIASTDAASVFSILRSKNLNLNNRIAALLEFESGSNDPFSYLLTIIILSVMRGQDINFTIIFLKQIFYGIVIGTVCAGGALLFLSRKQAIEGFYGVFLTAMVFLSFCTCTYIGGNGLLCVYIMGIILGNNPIYCKKILIDHFDVISWLMQVILFFLLGLLSFPSQFPSVAEPSIFLALFVMFVSRPVSIFTILMWFDFSLKEKIFISWVGLRGAASIVFAILAVTYIKKFESDIFHTVFFICLFSISIQGYFIPYFAKKLNLTE